MDLSEEYVRMCEESVEIQESFNYRQAKTTNKDFIAKKDDKLIWIPRQDQLQDFMVFPDDMLRENDFNNLKAMTVELITTFEKNPAVITMEMAWICTVMRFLHNKQWNFVNKTWEVI